MIYSAEKVLMNTIIRITVVSDKGTVFTKERIEDAFSCFDNVIDHFSRFNKNSELSKLNRGELMGKPLSKDLFDLISRSLDASYLTNGIYDPTVIDILEAYGYDSQGSFKALKDPNIHEEIKELIKNRPSYSEIELDEKNRKVKLQKEQRLDLGSIAKGYAVDLAYDKLAKHGFLGFLINAGGDIRAKGVNPKGLPWSIALFRASLPNSEIGHEPESWGNIDLYDNSIAGSGGWARKVGIFHHLIDIGSGMPLNEISQSFVIAPTCSDSDLWATISFLMGKASMPLIEKLGYEVMIVTFNGTIFKSSNFSYY